MVTSMVMLGWKASGLRCPDHEVECTDASGKHFPVSLIQMPNGTGKTTTLTLLRAALSGSASDSRWGEEKVKEYQKRDSSSNNGSFRVSLSLNGKKVTISMDFNFDQGTVSYYTTLPTGKRMGFHPPIEFHQFLNEGFVSFFIFDGELAKHLLDKRHSDARIVVESLFHTDLFTAMSRRIGEHWDKMSQRVGAAETVALTKRRNVRDRIRKQLSKCEKEENELKLEMENLEKRLKQREDHYNDEVKKEESYVDALREADTRYNESVRGVQESAADALKLMRSPHAIHSSFAESMVAFKDALDKAKLPESAAREFFDDIANESECICGREIDDIIADRIRERAQNYLGNNDVLFLNAMKSDIRDQVGSHVNQRSIQLIEQLDHLKKCMDEESKCHNDMQAARYRAEKSIPSARVVRDEIDKLNTMIDRVKVKLEKYGSSNDEGDIRHIYGIEVLREKAKSAEFSFSEMADTLKEKDKRDTLQHILKVAHDVSLEKILSEIRDDANERITNLMPNNSILIKEIRQNLVLEGRSGGSTGETLSVAYAFLATMFNGSDYQIPFVVDSPAGAIDLSIRPKIGELIPKLSKQFIAFTISSEREQFVDSLVDACSTAESGEVQFITLFSNGVEDMKSLACKIGRVEETHDGITVLGEKFFRSFQLDKEEA